MCIGRCPVLSLLLPKVRPGKHPLHRLHRLPQIGQLHARQVRQPLQGRVQRTDEHVTREQGFDIHESKGVLSREEDLACSLAV